MTLFCPACGVSNRNDNEECVECGEYLDPDPGVAEVEHTPTPKLRRRSGRGRRERGRPAPLDIERKPLSQTHRGEPSSSSMQSFVVIAAVVLLGGAGVAWYTVSDSKATTLANTSKNTGLVYPPGLQPRIDAFRAAWARSDVATLTRFYAKEFKFRADQLPERIDRRSWKSLPALGEPDLTKKYRNKPGTFVAFATNRGPIWSAWEETDAGWFLTRLVLP